MRYAIIEKSSDECVKFLHLTVVDAPVAQLDRVSDSDSEGRAFESHRAYQAPGDNNVISRGFYLPPGKIMLHNKLACDIILVCTICTNQLLD